MERTARHYANAFFEIALESKHPETYYDDVQILMDVVYDNPEALDLLSTYFIDEGDRYKIIDEVFSLLSEQDSKSFLKVLVSNHQINNLMDILQEFHDLWNDYYGIKKGFIYSVIPLRTSEIKKLEEVFFEKKQMRVELVNKVDESLIGGIKIVIQDKIFDGSLKSRIDSLKTSLKKEGER